MERLETKHSVGPQEWYPHHTSHWCCPSYYAGAYPYCPYAYSSFSHPYNYGTGIEWQHPYSYGYGQTHYSHGGIASTVDAQPVIHQAPQSPLNTGERPLTARREESRREQHRQGDSDRKPTTSTRFMRKRPMSNHNGSRGRNFSWKSNGRSDVSDWRNVGDASSYASAVARGSNLANLITCNDETTDRTSCADSTMWPSQGGGGHSAQENIRMERDLHMEARGVTMVTGASPPFVTDISQYGGHARDTSVELLELDEPTMEISAPTGWVGTRPPSSPEKSFTSPDQLIGTPLPNPGDSPVSSQWGSPVGDNVTVTAPAPAVSFLSQASLSKTRKKNEGNKHPVQTQLPQRKGLQMDSLVNRPENGRST